MQLMTTQPANELMNLQHAISHDIKDIDDLDEFLADDAEECMHAMLGNAGCIY